jgi:hypothetical protein
MSALVMVLRGGCGLRPRRGRGWDDADVGSWERKRPGEWALEAIAISCYRLLLSTRGALNSSASNDTAREPMQAAAQCSGFRVRVPGGCVIFSVFSPSHARDRELCRLTSWKQNARSAVVSGQSLVRVQVGPEYRARRGWKVGRLGISDAYNSCQSHLVCDV